VDPNNNAADGFTFTVQNDPNGTAALGDNGGGLGYAGIQNSVALFFDLYPGVSQVGQYVNGTRTDTFDLGGGGIDLHAGAALDVTLTYDGTQFRVTVTDDANPANTFSTTFSAVDIPGVVQGTTAYVGFTGGTGGSTSIQDIRTWSYVDPPAPYRPPEPAAGARSMGDAGIPARDVVRVLSVSMDHVPQGLPTGLPAPLPKGFDRALPPWGPKGRGANDPAPDVIDLAPENIDLFLSRSARAMARSCLDSRLAGPGPDGDVLEPLGRIEV
jgi:hypothetical protein